VSFEISSCQFSTSSKLYVCVLVILWG
jgi:hypothetical protein